MTKNIDGNIAKFFEYLLLCVYFQNGKILITDRKNNKLIVRKKK